MSEVAQLLETIRTERAEIAGLRAELLELVGRVGALERTAQVAAGDRDDRAKLLGGFDGRLRRLETAPVDPPA